MNGAHLHLLVNHLPVLGVPFGVLLGAFGLARRDDGVARAALGVLVLCAAATYAAGWTGGGAEHVLERAVAGIDHGRIHAHEEWADRASIAAYVVAALALATLALSWGRALRRGLALACVVLALVPAALLARTATLGGEIRHTEITAEGAARLDALPQHRERGGDDG